MSAQKAKLESQKDATQFVEEEIKAFVRASPLNRLPFDRDYIIWDEPLVHFA